MRSLLAVIAVLASVSSIRADEAPLRTVDFTIVLTDQNNRPMETCPNPGEKDCSKKEVMTLGSVAFNALSLPEQGLALDKGLKRGQLAMAVAHANSAKLTASDITTIEECVAKLYNPFILFRVVSIIDPNLIK